ncbi:MAG TPA: hypothetical protein VNZ85_02430 [Caulobacter sp.]|nr:hypothetical protein [Caulobacter sp.]
MDSHVLFDGASARLGFYLRELFRERIGLGDPEWVKFSGLSFDLSHESLVFSELVEKICETIENNESIRRYIAGGDISILLENYFSPFNLSECAKTIASERVLKAASSLGFT